LVLALKSAGVIFIEENGEVPGTRLGKTRNEKQDETGICATASPCLRAARLDTAFCAGRSTATLTRNVNPKTRFISNFEAFLHRAQIHHLQLNDQFLPSLDRGFGGTGSTRRDGHHDALNPGGMNMPETLTHTVTDEPVIDLDKLHQAIIDHITALGLAESQADRIAASVFNDALVAADEAALMPV